MTKMHENKVLVTEEMTALQLGSGDLKVLATPIMIAEMERAAAQLASSMIKEGYTTVGTAIHVTHQAPTPVGAEIRVVAELLEENGKSFSFKVEAYDCGGLIGEGTHNRVAVNCERFLEKCYSKC